MHSPELVAATRLQLLTRDRNHRLEVELHGDLDETTGPRLLSALDAGMANPTIHAVHVNARHLRSVDEEGLSTLVDAHGRAASSGRSFSVGDAPASLVGFAQHRGIEDLLGLEPGPRSRRSPSTSAAQRPDGGPLAVSKARA